MGVADHAEDDVADFEPGAGGAVVVLLGRADDGAAEVVEGDLGVGLGGVEELG